VPPYGKEIIFLSFGGEKGRDDFEERPVLSASMVKHSGAEENVGRS
jgi:hypothetical protein